MPIPSFVRVAAAAGLAGLLAACQTSQPPAATAEARLLAAGYVKQTDYPKPFGDRGTYDARFVCGPPACAAQGSVSYFTTRLIASPSGSTGEERLRSESIADVRRNLQAAADRRGSGRRYTGAQRVSTPGAAAYESSSTSPTRDGLSYTRSRATVRGDGMRITVSNGANDAVARRGLQLGREE